MLAIRDQVAPPTINYRHARSGVRSRLRAQHRAAHEDRCRAVEFLRLRRHQRHADLPPLHRVSGNGYLSHALPFGPEDLRRLAYADPANYPVLLDSAAAGPLGRYSILAAYPQAALWLDSDGMLQRSGAAPAAAPRQGFLEALEQLWSRESERMAPRGAVGDCPFRGGWVVFLGYELAAEIEPQLGLPAATAQNAPRAFALRTPAALIYDHAGRAGPGDHRAGPCGPALAAHRARGALGASPMPGARQRSGHRRARARGGGSRALRPAAVDQALEHIRAGDIYQANLSRGWRAGFRARLQGDALQQAGARSTSACARESGAVCRAGAVAGLASAQLLARAAGARGAAATSRRARSPARGRAAAAPMPTGARSRR